MKKTLFLIFVLLCAVSVFAKEINVADYGAKGDGVTDNTEAFQKALDAAADTGGTVFADSGNYL
ncbi:MAG: glycoside hydrolase family 28 protein, partial [Armatimonadetes bacterium]|nr:glycoside hydrolase family 28 protein [Candidatus Hippobium faecium]